MVIAILHTVPRDSEIESENDPRTQTIVRGWRRSPSQLIQGPNVGGVIEGLNNNAKGRVEEQICLSDSGGI
jgi:hypothetical protein